MVMNLWRLQKRACKSPLIDKVSAFVYGGKEGDAENGFRFTNKKYRRELSMSQDDPANPIYIKTGYTVEFMLEMRWSMAG